MVGRKNYYLGACAQAGVVDTPARSRRWRTLVGAHHYPLHRDYRRILTAPA